MRSFLSLIFILLLFSCDQTKTEKKEKVNAPVKKRSGKMFAGKPDLPVNDTMITSAGIGKIHLSDPISKVNSLYDSVVDIGFFQQGENWPAKRIMLENNQWIIAGTAHSVDKVTSLRTNSSSFKTKNNLRVGMPVDSIDTKTDSLIIDTNENAFLLYQSGIWFKIDPESERKFFKSKSPDIRNLKKASIKELFIICGDC